MSKVKYVGSPSETLQCLTDVRQWEGFLDGQRVKLSEVNTKVERPILLPHQHNSITPWAVAWSDDLASNINFKC